MARSSSSTCCDTALVLISVSARASRALERIELRLALRDDGHRRRALGLALVHKALRGLDADRGAAQLRFGLAALRLQLVGVHPRQHLAGRHEIALGDQDVADAAGDLVEMSISVASIRPLPLAMPGGSDATPNRFQPK